MTAVCRDWYAWLNTMPPPPDDFHVIGDVTVGNPGVEAVLTMSEPQGINASILMLDLNLVQKPGIWPQVISCAQARFDRILPPNSTRYTSVEIRSNGQLVGKVDNIDIVS